MNLSWVSQECDSFPAWGHVTGQYRIEKRTCHKDKDWSDEYNSSNFLNDIVGFVKGWESDKSPKGKINH